MLRNRKDLISVEDSGVPLLIRDHDNLDTSTPLGKNVFGKLVVDAELEGDLIGERVRSALRAAKRRGKKLGTRNPRVKGKGAQAVTAAAQKRSKAFLPFLKPLHGKGCGARTMMKELNAKQKAVDISCE